MFQLNPNPIVLQFYSLKLTYYLLNLILAFLTILFVLLNASKNKKLALCEKEIYSFVILLILGTVVGARLFYIIFWDLNFYLQNPIKIFYIWQGGLSFHGGLFGATIIAIIYSKIKKLSIMKVVDILVLPSAFFLALGRIANFFNSEILGITTILPWCVVFQNIDNVCRHPIQLYAAAGRLLLFFFLLTIKKKFKNHKPGLIFWTFVLFISTGRFFLDFLRDERSFHGLMVGQWFSIILIVISILAFKKLKLLNSTNSLT